jgi:hypothetical protein
VGLAGHGVGASAASATISSIFLHGGCRETAVCAGFTEEDLWAKMESQSSSEYHDYQLRKVVLHVRNLEEVSKFTQSQAKLRSGGEGPENT